MSQKRRVSHVGEESERQRERKCKGPEAGTWLVCRRRSQEVRWLEQ